MVNKWIFVLTEYSDYNAGSVESIIINLMKNNVWSIGKKTVYKDKLKEGDDIIFYVSGKDRMYFGASTKLNSKYTYDKGEFHGFVEINGLNVFEEPVYIKPLLKKLNFIKNTSFWGLYLSNGIVKINDNDYKLIISQASLQDSGL